MAGEVNGPLGPRIGTFFILAGIMLIALFVVTDIAQDPNFDYFFLGSLGLVVGFFLRRGAPKPAPSNRFEGIRKIRENAKKRKAEQAKKKEDKKKKK